ncbi:hypothetical protein [Ruicaihuangia caeni]|uniref:DUF2975 domain-containing protein n=1 Tax=Ruicaihuangia caeni TaxID=3042517 RepID=A0AAW6T3R9_9MICO|nr:hypothetical protein [Klugiella sp. YN-L-19]MDI2098466.1 hypothetical protein [Klugiella sp. YN-L-19]
MASRPPQRTTRLSSARSGLRGSERFSLWLLAAVAATIGALSIVGAATSIVGLFDARGASVPLFTDAPVPDDAATGSATIVSGAFTEAQVVIAGLEPWSLVLLAGGIAVGALIFAALAALFVALCVAVLRGKPFGRSMTWIVATVSVTLIVGGLTSFALTGIGQFWIVDQLNASPGDTIFPTATAGDLTPVFIGIGLAAIGAAFEIGARLQRDTEGLV